jgi:hypothetical protein
VETLKGISPEQLQQIINLVYVLVLAVVGLGSVGIGAAIVTLRQHKDLLRMVYASASPETQLLLRNVALSVNDVADLAVEVTTGAPAAAPKPSTVPWPSVVLDDPTAKG